MKSEIDTVERPRRLVILDPLRIVATVLIVLFHWTFRGPRGDLSDVAYEEIGQFAAVRYGWLGLPLFFMISGFVILWSAEGKSARAFTESRLLRLYPAFWLSVLVTATVLALFGDERFPTSVQGVLANLTMIPARLGQPFVDGVYWSLEVELVFYFWVFVILAVGQLHRIEWASAGWLVISAVGLTGVLPAALVNIVFVTTHAGFFAAGLVFFTAWRSGWTGGRALLVLAALPISYEWSARGSDEAVVSYNTTYSRPLIAVCIVGMFVFFWMLSMHWFDGLRFKERTGRLVTLLGALTYPVYLLHQNIVYVMVNRLGDSTNRWLLLLLAVIVIAVLSYATLRAERIVRRGLRRILAVVGSRVFGDAPSR